MHSHKLILEKDRSKAQWTLEWDESYFRLKGPGDQTVLEAQTAKAHRLIELQNLYSLHRVCFVTPNGSLVFKRQKAAFADVRSLVEAGLRSDPDYRQQIRERSRKLALRGLMMFLGGGIPFLLYGLWASWAPKPSSALFRSVGPFIHLGLLLLLGLFAGGIGVLWFGLSQQMRLRRIETDLSSTENQRKEQ
jgi:hypothetical protein